MKFCIVGAGAIGGYLGARLALAGEEVAFIARGANRDAIEARGIRVVYPDREEVAPARAFDSFERAGKHDVVLLTLKAHQLGEVAPRIEALCHDDTVVMPMQNGIPFWYFSRLKGPLEDRALESVDPGGRISGAIPARRIVGSVVFVAAERVGPGVVRYTGNNIVPVGELDGTRTPRVEAISQAFTRAGFDSQVLDDIRSEVWLKLWGNVSFNPISALTRAVLCDICTDPDGRDLVARMMGEAQAVGEKLGAKFRIPVDKRIAAAERVGRHKTSMLQDVEARRPLEIDALVGSVVEMGELVGVETPTIRAMYQAVRLLDRTNK